MRTWNDLHGWIVCNVTRVMYVIHTRSITPPNNKPRSNVYIVHVCIHVQYVQFYKHTSPEDVNMLIYVHSLTDPVLHTALEWYNGK